MNEKIKETGRLRYIEPTNFFKQQEGALSDGINYPYEDYNISVDLTIKQTNRYCCGWWNQTGDMTEITYSSKNGTISFLGGTKIGEDEGYLTTNYTDISMTNPETNTSECLGISSIDITYDSWMYPQVTIKFVDTRGATIMLPAEKGYYNNGNVGNASALYKGLFSFPYPMFILKVKGFYGKGVTYRLALYNSVYEFDANTGNFNITATFIGYMFGIYADIPVSFLGIAPYMNGGREYWKQKVESGEFTFSNSNGTNTYPMPTIPELKLKLAQAASNQEAISAAGEGAEVAAIHSQRLDSIVALKDAFPFNNWFHPKNSKYCYNIYEKMNDIIIDAGSLREYAKAVLAYDDIYGTHFLDGMGVLKDFSDTEFKNFSILDNLIHFIPNGENGYIPGNLNPVFNTVLSVSSNAKDVYERIVTSQGEDVKEYIESARLGKTDFYLVAINKESSYFDPNVFLNEVEKEQKAINKLVKEQERYYKEKEAAAIEKVIGFRPSIKNIFELMFAHMDTFIHSFYASTKIIKDQLETDKVKRLKSTYNITDGYTDTENEKIKTSNGTEITNSNQRSKYLPPYAAYYTDNTTGVSKGKTLIWLEQLTKGSQLEEVNFVNNLIAGAETFFKNVEEVEKIIEQLGASGSPIDSTFTDVNTPSINISNFVPVTIFDFIFKDKYENPYNGVKKRLSGSADDIEAEILTILSLRGLQYIYSCESDREKSYQNAAAFGKIDAINLFKALGDDFTPGYLEFLKKYISFQFEEKYTEEDLGLFQGKKALTRKNEEARAEAFNNGIKDIMSQLVGNSNSTLNTKLNNGAPNLNKSIFKESDGYLIYNYHKGNDPTNAYDNYGFMKLSNKQYQMLPVYTDGIKQLQNYYTQGDEMFNNQCLIPMYSFSQAYSGPKSDVTTFAVFNSRDYIKNIYNLFEMELNSAVDYVEDGKPIYGNRGSGDYNDLENREEILAEYKNNIFLDKLNKNQYFANVLTDDTAKQKGPKDIEELINNGSYDEQKRWNIKYPTFDYTFNSERPTSIFNNSIYWKQEELGDKNKELKAKAYLFLCSAPIVGNEIGIEKVNTCGRSLKSILLREGAYYWRMDNPDSIIFPDKVDYVRKTIKSPSYSSVKIKKPEHTEVPMFNNTEWWDKNFSSINYETYASFKLDSGSYSKIVSPSGTSQSRRKILKKFFEDWAVSTDEKSGFAANESRLTNIKFYSKELTDKGVERLGKETPYWFNYYFLERNTHFYDEFDGKKTGTESENFYENYRNYDNGLDTTFLLVQRAETQDAFELRKLQEFLRDLFFGVCTVFDVYSSSQNEKMVAFSTESLMFKNKRIESSSQPIRAERNLMEGVIDGFIRQLILIYYKPMQDYVNKKSTFYNQVALSTKVNPFKNTDIKLSTYMTLKNLYDKWLCSPYNGPEHTWELTKKKGSKSEFDNFLYVDSFYNDIGDKLLVNVTNVSNWLNAIVPSSDMSTTDSLMAYTGKTMYEFLAGVAENCGGTLLAVPQKFGLTSAEDVEKMFTPISLYSDWDEDSSGYVFMYSYKPSEHLGDTTTSNTDMNGWSPDGDGLDLTDDEIIGRVFSSGDDAYPVPSFGVTYAKQNQSIFKNIQLTTATMAVTEASISATLNIASKASESPRETVLYGQDLYRVYSNYAYHCVVEAMGNVQILPLMYFQLNNIPFWRGAYMIIKVSHNIVAGNMTTIFEGVRVNRYAIPMADGAVIIEPITGDETEDSDGSSGGTYYGNGVQNNGNGQMTKPGDTSPNPNINIPDTIDFDTTNISSKKPIICVCPAHGPNTSKKIEWAWSTKVADKMVSILKEYKYSDGTPYNVQRCNKNGAHTSKGGYSTIEMQNLIKKYGSEQVVSVVPHWNGMRGNWHGVFVNKASKTTRQDSMNLAKCLVADFKNLKSRRNEFETMPTGMMDGDVSVKNLGETNTDGAPNLNCACVLTENWFADYGPKGSYWSGEEWDLKENGKFVTGRGWMETDEAITNIAQAHADGIKRYIDSL